MPNPDHQRAEEIAATIRALKEEAEQLRLKQLDVEVVDEEEEDMDQEEPEEPEEQGHKQSHDEVSTSLYNNRLIRAMCVQWFSEMIAKKSEFGSDFSSRMPWMDLTVEPTILDMLERLGEGGRFMNSTRTADITKHSGWGNLLPNGLRFSNKNLVVLQRAGYSPMFNLLGSLNMNGKDLERFVDGFGGPNAHYLKMPAHLYDDDCTDEQARIINAASQEYGAQVKEVIRKFSMDEINTMMLDPFYMHQNAHLLGAPHTREEILQTLYRNEGDIETSVGNVCENVPTPSWKAFNQRSFSKKFLNLIGDSINKPEHPSYMKPDGEILGPLALKEQRFQARRANLYNERKDSRQGGDMEERRVHWQAKNHQLGVDPSPSKSTVDRTVVVEALHQKLDADHEVMSSLENSRGEGGEEQLAAKKTEQAFRTPNAIKAFGNRMARHPPTKIPAVRSTRDTPVNLNKVATRLLTQKIKKKNAAQKNTGPKKTKSAPKPTKRAPVRKRKLVPKSQGAKKKQK